MTTLNVTDTLSAGPAQRLRLLAAPVRVHFTWWGTHKTLTQQQKELAAIAHRADSRLITAGKKLIDTRHRAFRKLTSLRCCVMQDWRRTTLPFTEPGVRLLRRDDVPAFVHRLEGYREALRGAEQDLRAGFDSIKEDARQRLGRLFDPHDYPANFRGLFDLSWDFPAVEPPPYLLRISAETYQHEQERVAEQFRHAVELAEQAFLSEFAKLVDHLVRRLIDDGTGARKIFRDSAVTNLLEFFNRFRRLSIRSNDDLERLAAQAEDLVRGVPPQALRTKDELRQHIAEQMSLVQHSLELMLVDAPRRRILRMPSNVGADCDPGP